MTINQMRRVLSKTSTLLGDVNALMRGRIVQRIANRAIGRAASRATRRLWWR